MSVPSPDAAAGPHRSWRERPVSKPCNVPVWRQWHHLASNIVIMWPSKLNGKTNSCIENVDVKGVGISEFSFVFFEIWKSAICATELCFSCHEKKNVSQYDRCQDCIFITVAKLQVLVFFLPPSVFIFYFSVPFQNGIHS